jgi:glycosyltransferase involved in cell wall biosynthesis
MNENELPHISVIIPVYNGQEYARLCMQKLNEQNYPKDKTEIIAVDNGSTDHTVEIVKKMGARVVHESKKGPAAARNRGLKDAKGDILILIDIDCLAEQDFILNHVLAHLRFQTENPKIKLVAGSIEGLNRNLWSRCDDYTSWTAFHSRLPSGREYTHCPSANISFRKALYHEIGGFDEKLRFGEDVAFCYKIADNGYETYFEAKATVKHINRTSFKAFIKHAMEWSSGDYLLKKTGYVSYKNRINFIVFQFESSLILFFEPFYYSFKTKRYDVLFYTPFILLHRMIWFGNLIRLIAKE